jgi:hypothetical protein
LPFHLKCCAIKNEPSIQAVPSQELHYARKQRTKGM